MCSYSAVSLTTTTGPMVRRVVRLYLLSAASNSNGPPTPRTTGASSSHDDLLYNVAAVDAGPPLRGAGPVLQHASHPQRDIKGESDMLLAELETFNGSKRAFMMLPQPPIEDQADPNTPTFACCFSWVSFVCPKCICFVFPNRVLYVGIDVVYVLIVGSQHLFPVYSMDLL